MKFSYTVKEELYSTAPKKICCVKSMLFAMCIFSNAIYYKDFVLFETKNKKIIDMFVNLMKKISSSEITIDISKSLVYSVKIKLKYIDKDLLSMDDCCRISILKIAFLMYGTVVDPKKEYRIEFNMTTKEQVSIICNILDELSSVDVNPHINLKNNRYCVYFRDYNDIEELLSIMGSYQGVMQLVQIKMLREERNRINRTNNFETANIRRGADASIKQIRAIKKILNNVKEETLPLNLRQIALLRLENPNASLSELSKLSGLNKSTVNYRLNKLIEKSKEYI